MNASTSDDYVIRAIRADEWMAAKRLRLDALRDPVAHIAFMTTYEEAEAMPDSFFQERALASGEGAPGARQFIAEAPDGTWVGSATVLLEKPGAEDWAGYPVDRLQGQVVGVFVRPEHRGRGLTEALLGAGAAWAWEQEAERVRLFVHENNTRAQAAYRKAGFVPSGVAVKFAKFEAEMDLEFVLERRS
ncbi:GNAT family N-acetyltransferase [Streptomyces sp. NPDC048297]|uniref:GNAT family N-acetyltransferase n=1 Tax=Streptomyces sp. NPDC048297 TaxID=3365531 RepID=UPI003721F878